MPKGLVIRLVHPASSSWISDMVARKKPSRPKTSRAGRPGAGRNDDAGEKTGSVAERLRARRRSTKAAGPEPAQEPPEAPIANAESAAAGGGLDATTVASSKPARKTRPATPARRAAADRRDPQEAPSSETKSVDSPSRRPRSRGASQRRKRPARARGLCRRRSKLTPRPQKPRAASRPRAATPTLTTPTTPATAAAAISPELGLGLAQALSAELAGLSHRLLEAGSASARQLASARSVPEFMRSRRAS